MNEQSSPPAGEAQNEISELLIYREKVVELLQSRELKYQALEQDRLRLSYLLGEASVQKLVRSGDASKIMAGDAIRRSYTSELQKVENEIIEAREELRKADERLVQVDDDILKLGGQIVEQWKP